MNYFVNFSEIIYLIECPLIAEEKILNTVFRKGLCITVSEIVLISCPMCGKPHKLLISKIVSKIEKMSSPRKRGSITYQNP